jgi:DNA polymerase I-like protein with 3'-5' exonuclease and polymerase domains
MDRKLIIVNDTKTLSQLITHINSYTTFAYDTETTGLIPVRDKVIGFSISGKIGEAYYVPHLTWDTKAEDLVEVFSFKKIKELLNLLKGKELLMWNGSFDVRFTKGYFGVDFVDELLADVMLMKHTVEEEGFFGLKPTAIQYQKEIKLDVEKEANEEQIALKENVEKNGGSITKAKYEMYKADLDIMGVYAAADADLTLRLAHLFREKLEKEGLVDFFYDDEIMPLYKLVTIPMESNPVEMDIDLIKEYRDNILVDINKLHEEVITELLDIDHAKRWLADKANLKFPPKATGNFAQKIVKKFNLPLPLSPTGKHRVTKALINKLPESDAKQFLLGKHPNGYKTVKATELSRKMYPSLVEEDGWLIGWEQVEQDISIELWEEFNKGNKINISSKKQLAEIVFDYIGVGSVNKTPTGAPQFDDAMIQILAETGFTWASKLSDYNKLIKIKSAYMDRFLDNQIDGGYYFYYKQHGTLSGRYSSDAQQLPRPKEEGELSPLVLKYNNAIRAFFVAGKGRKFIDADYESLEPHVFAHVSGDEGLRNIFRKGHDFYSTIAIQTEKLSGMSADKKADNYLGKMNKPLRQNAKAYSLGVPYGMTPYALAKTLGVDIKVAEKLYKGYLDGFPKLKEWMEQSKLDAQYKGFVTTQTGRVRHLNKVKELHKVHGEKLLNFKYRQAMVRKRIPKLGKFEAEKLVKGLYLDYKNGINNARNVQIQGLSASIVNRAMIDIMKGFRLINLDGYVCATVHDQIIVNVLEKDLDKAMKIVQDRMTTVVKLSVDLKAPPEIADNWRDSH